MIKAIKSSMRRSSSSLSLFSSAGAEDSKILEELCRVSSCTDLNSMAPESGGATQQQTLRPSRPAERERELSLHMQGERHKCPEDAESTRAFLQDVCRRSHAVYAILWRLGRDGYIRAEAHYNDPAWEAHVLERTSTPANSTLFSTSSKPPIACKLYTDESLNYRFKIGEGAVGRVVVSGNPEYIHDVATTEGAAYTRKHAALASRLKSIFMDPVGGYVRQAVEYGTCVDVGGNYLYRARTVGRISRISADELSSAESSYADLALLQRGSSYDSIRDAELPMLGGDSNPTTRQPSFTSSHGGLSQAPCPSLQGLLDVH